MIVANSPHNTSSSMKTAKLQSGTPVSMNSCLTTSSSNSLSRNDSTCLVFAQSQKLPKTVGLPIHSNSSPITSKSTGSSQTVSLSPKTVKQQISSAAMLARRVLTYSENTNTSPGRTVMPKSAPTALKDAATLKLPTNIESASTSTSNITTVSGSGRPKQTSTLQSLLCVVCQRTPHNPLRSECCGTLYCESCSKKVEKCPQHRQKQLTYTADTELFNLIQKLQCKCKYVGNGCTWLGVVAKQSEHILVCPYSPSSESACGVVY